MKHGAFTSRDAKLLSAAALGSTDRVRQVLDKPGTMLKVRANPNASDSSHGYTSLHYACEHKNVGMIDLLLERGADPNQSDKKGEVPLHKAAKCDADQCIAHLAHRKELVVDAKDSLGDTALLVACRNGSVAAAKALLWRYACRKAPTANVNVRDCISQTPLHIAVTTDNQDLLYLLLTSAHARYECYDDNGATPISLAYKKGNQAMIQIFEDWVGEERLLKQSLEEEQEMRQKSGEMTAALEQEARDEHQKEEMHEIALEQQRRAISAAESSVMYEEERNRLMKEVEEERQESQAAQEAGRHHSISEAIRLEHEERTRRTYEYEILQRVNESERKRSISKADYMWENEKAYVMSLQNKEEETNRENRLQSLHDAVKACEEERYFQMLQLVAFHCASEANRHNYEQQRGIHGDVKGKFVEEPAFRSGERSFSFLKYQYAIHLRHSRRHQVLRTELKTCASGLSLDDMVRDGYHPDDTRVLLPSLIKSQLREEETGLPAA